MQSHSTVLQSTIPKIKVSTELTERYLPIICKGPGRLLAAGINQSPRRCYLIIAINKLIMNPIKILNNSVQQSYRKPHLPGRVIRKLKSCVTAKTQLIMIT